MRAAGEESDVRGVIAQHERGLDERCACVERGKRSGETQRETRTTPSATPWHPLLPS